MEAIVDGDREELDYGTFGVATRQLCQQVVDSGFEPDWIVAIARGGLLIGGAVAYALRCKNIGVVNVEFYTDIDERLEVPVMRRFGSHRGVIVESRSQLGLPA